MACRQNILQHEYPHPKQKFSAFFSAKQNRRCTYTNLPAAGRLCDCLQHIDAQADEQFASLIRQVAEPEEITKALKASHQMKWAGQMNSIRSRAEEIINSGLICS